MSYMIIKELQRNKSLSLKGQRSHFLVFQLSFIQQFGRRQMVFRVSAALKIHQYLTNAVIFIQSPAIA